MLELVISVAAITVLVVVVLITKHLTRRKSRPNSGVSKDGGGSVNADNE